MNCFKCGSKCLTSYGLIDGRFVVEAMPGDNITAVRKDCMNCEWHSYPTKVPEPRSSL
jgi:hypothetical protein